MKSSAVQTSGFSLAALLLGAVIIGLSPILVRLSDLGAIATAFWRVALAMLPLLAWRSFKGGPQGEEKPQTVRDFAVLLVPGLLLAADLLAWHLSIHLTSVANATLLANMAPIFVVLGGWVLFRTTVTRSFLVGLALAVAGVAVLSRASAGSGGESHLAGDATAIVAAVFYAGYILSVSRLRSRYNTLTILLWSSCSAAICILPVALIVEPTLLPATTTAWLIVLALAWLCHFGGQGLIVYALALLPASFSSLTLLIQPVVAALVAWLVLNEPLGALQALGGVIVLAGILLARRS